MNYEKYKKKYKNALAHAREIHRNEEEKRKDMEFLFPELKENEDERIKRRIIEYIKIKTGTHHKDWLDWLEKQSMNNKPLYIRFGDIPKDEKSKIYNGEIEIGTENGISVYPAFEDLDGNIVLGLSLPITKTSLYTQQHLLEYDNKSCYLVSGDYVGRGTDGEPLLRNVKIIREIKNFRVKQGEQKQDPCEHCNDMCLNCQNFPCIKKRAFEQGKSVWEIINEEKVDNANKIEPKFKVGDWIVSNINKDIFLIKSVNNGYCTLEDAKGRIYSPCLPPTENDYHRWTIQDAKAGDVLSFENDEIKWILIYKELVPSLQEVPHDLLRYYAILNDGYLNYNGVSAMITDGYEYYLKPATKEQRDILFDKMKEAEYTFDFEKKELKEIVVPIFNIGDTIVKKHNSNIQDFGSFTITDVTGGKYWYNDRIICDISEQDEWELYEPVSQPSNGWSEEDDRIYYSLLADIKARQNSSTNTLEAYYNEQIDWLKSLKDRVQPKVELTQVDKNILEAAIAFVEHNNHFNCWRGVDKRTVLSALYSLKPQNTFKLSDEQMKALNIAIRCGIQLGTWEEKALKELREQLKKL